MYIPAFRWDGATETRIITGFERFNLDSDQKKLSFFLFI